MLPRKPTSQRRDVERPNLGRFTDVGVVLGLFEAALFEHGGGYGIFA